ncbi:MAG: nicotinamide riboside transporter PnuC [Halieaceae bacterium]|nr:nicotinamide riboside transporter PnuC [Halieaceae bacterium]
MEFTTESITLEQIVELVAVIFGLAYVVLAIRLHHWCWYMTLYSSALFLWLFWNVELYLMSLLQLFFMGIATYGIFKWNPKSSNLEKRITIINPKHHLYILSSIVLSSIVIGWFLNHYTDDAFPYLDTFTAVGSLITSWMVAKKILENWLYWVVIDAVSIYIYIERELYLTVLLFTIYLIMAALGYHQWKLSYQQQ